VFVRLKDGRILVFGAEEARPLRRRASSRGLPVGLSIIGPRFADRRLLQASRASEGVSEVSGACAEIAAG
jgi:hypothetical protein